MYCCAVLLEGVDQRHEALAVLGGRCVVQRLDAGHVLALQLRGSARLLGVVRVELGQLGRELRAVLADRPAYLRLRPQHDVLANLHLGQHLGPDLGLPVVDHDRLQQPGIEHLEHVLVLERARQVDELGFGLACLLEALVQRLHAQRLARDLAKVHGLARKVVDRGDGRRGRAGHQDLDAGGVLVGGDEVHVFQQLGEDLDVADRDIGVPFEKIFAQLVARGDDDDRGQRALAELCRVFLVHPALELADQVGRDAPLAALVDEVQRAAVGQVEPDRVALQHAVEIALPDLRTDVEAALIRFAGGRRSRGCLRRRLCCRGLRARPCGKNERQKSRAEQANKSFHRGLPRKSRAVPSIGPRTRRAIRGNPCGDLPPGAGGSGARHVPK